MASFKPQVYMDRSNRSCIAVGTDIGGIEIVSLNGDGLGFTVVPNAAFAETWTASDYDLDRALDRYSAHIKSRENNHPDAVARIQALVEARKENLAPAADLDLQLDTPAPTASAGQGVADALVVNAEETPTPVGEVVSPVIQDVLSPSSDAAMANEALSPHLSTEKEVPMSDLELNQNPGGNELQAAEVTTPTVAAPIVSAPAAAPVSQQPVPVAQSQQGKSAADLQESDLDANYSVTVNGGSVTVAMGAAKPRRLDDLAYANREQIVVNQPKEPKFVVATDQNGVLARVISMDDADRKVSGALIGGWIADGYTVTTVALKDLAKLVGAARKVYEPKKATGAEPVNEPE